MNWSGPEIRNLRYRLGWSQAELARCLGCQSSSVLQWEKDQEVPPQETSKSLLQILHQADSLSERIQRRPIAEVMMADQGLEQIHDSDVMAYEHLTQLNKLNFQE